MAEKTEKVMWNLPISLVNRVRREAARRTKLVGVERGMQTAVVKEALEVGLKKLEQRC